MSVRLYGKQRNRNLQTEYNINCVLTDIIWCGRISRHVSKQLLRREGLEQIEYTNKMFTIGLKTLRPLRDFHDQS